MQSCDCCCSIECLSIFFMAFLRSTESMGKYPLPLTFVFITLLLQSAIIGAYSVTIVMVVLYLYPTFTLDNVYGAIFDEEDNVKYQEKD